jgi:predicted RNase H-like HicB family nuclease
MKVAEDITISITPKNPNSNWVTVDEHGKVISEGKTPAEAIENAKKITEDFSVIFVPKEGNTYIF